VRSERYVAKIRGSRSGAAKMSRLCILYYFDQFLSSHSAEVERLTLTTPLFV
jgi:hypothetical protein